MGALKSFVEVRPDSHFPIQNLPYGVFKPDPTLPPRPGVAIGEYVLDLSEIASAGLFDGPLLRGSDSFHQPMLNKFVSLGRAAWKEARATIQKLLSWGQSFPVGDSPPSFGPSKKLDFELEMGFWRALS